MAKKRVVPEKEVTKEARKKNFQLESDEFKQKVLRAVISGMRYKEEDLQKAIRSIAQKHESMGDIEALSMKRPEKPDVNLPYEKPRPMQIADELATEPEPFFEKFNSRPENIELGLGPLGLLLGPGAPFLSKLFKGSEKFAPDKRMQKSKKGPDIDREDMVLRRWGGL